MNDAFGHLDSCSLGHGLRLTPATICRLRCKYSTRQWAALCLAATFMTSDGITRFQISTNAFEGRERLDEFCETFGRAILKVEIDPTNDMPLDIQMDVRVLPGLAMAIGSISTMQVRHTPQLINDDDIVLVAIEKGAAHLKQAGREAFVKAGEAVLTSTGEVGTFSKVAPTTLTNLRLSRAALANDVLDLDSAVARVIPMSHPALRLLIGYSSLLNDQQGLETAELRRSFVAHMHDLAALALGAKRDAAETAKLRGVRAARLHAVKADILNNITQADLSIDAVALRQGLSRSYIGQLLAADGTTFTDLVLDRRLVYAHRALTNWRYADRKISVIAFEAGFGDLSYFNRAFRRRYGVTPSDVRAAALESSAN
jgi:AraC-like DNA-binding protein